MLLGAGLAASPSHIRETVRAVCLQRCLNVLERGECACLVLDLETCNE